MQVSSWVTHLIISQPTHEDRKSVLSCILRVALSCWNIGNFNGAMEIVAGLKYAYPLLQISRRTLSKNWVPCKKKVLLAIQLEIEGVHIICIETVLTDHWMSRVWVIEPLALFDCLWYAHACFPSTNMHHLHVP